MLRAYSGPDSSALTDGAHTVCGQHAEHGVHEEMCQLEDFVALLSDPGRAGSADNVEAAQGGEASPSGQCASVHSAVNDMSAP